MKCIFDPGLSRDGILTPSRLDYTLKARKSM